MISQHAQVLKTTIWTTIKNSHV